MPIVNPSLTQFNTGEITPFLMGRTDFKKYPAAAQYMENCVPLVYGPFLKRSGTRYVNSVKASAISLLCTNEELELVRAFKLTSSNKNLVITKGATSHKELGKYLFIYVTANTRWEDADGNPVTLSEYGVANLTGTPANDDTITYEYGIVPKYAIDGEVIPLTYNAEEDNWYNIEGDIADLYKYGIDYVVGTPNDGDVITCVYTLAPDAKVVLKPFIFSKTQAYTLEIGAGYIRFHAKNGTLIDRVAPTRITGSITKAECTDADKFGAKVDFEDGEYVFTYNGTNWLFNGETATLSDFAIEIEGTPANNDTITIDYLDAAIVEVDTDFNSEDLENLDFAQSNDYLYIASGRLPLKVLKRYSHKHWELENVDFADGPYQDENTDKGITIASSATAVGSATNIESNVDFFTRDMVGMPIRLRKTAVGSSASNAIGWATITEYVSPTKVVGLVEEQFFDTAATYAWRIGEFSDERGYPKKVTLFKGRLCLASTETKPNSLWLSRADSYHDFGPTTMLDNEVNDDDAIYMTMATTQTNQIQWMSALRQLFVGTLGSEFRIGGTNEVITPSNCSSEEISQYGSTAITPCKYANELVYVQQAERKVRTMYYDLGTDAYNSTDLSLFGEHLTYSGISGIAQQIEPFSTLWTWLKNGDLRSISYQKDQEVVAWARQNLGGNRVRVLSACVIPYIEENRDQVWLLVERWIDYRFVRYIETLDRVFDDQVDQEHGYFVDCGGTYDNPLPIGNIYPVGTQTVVYCPNHGLETGARVRFADIAAYDNTSGIGYEELNTKSYYVQVYDEDNLIINVDTNDYVEYTEWQGGVIRAYISEITEGLDHLEGEEVWVVIDGAVTPKTKVINGAVRLDMPGTIVNIGLPYTCKYKSVRLDTALGQNNALASKQRIHQIYIKVLRTNYFLYGADEATELKPARKYTIDKLDFAPALKTELVEIPFEVDWTREPCITIVSDLPLPLCVLGITTQMSLNIT